MKKLSQILDLKDKKILDWGSGMGYFIYDSGYEIDVSKYTGVDVCKTDIDNLKSCYWHYHQLPEECEVKTEIKKLVKKYKILKRKWNHFLGFTRGKING